MWADRCWESGLILLITWSFSGTLGTYFIQFNKMDNVWIFFQKIEIVILFLALLEKKRQ